MKLSHRTTQHSGFTIVELIVIIVVIGVLAGISIFGYGAWQKNTRTTQVKSDLKAAAAAMEDARNFNNEYPASAATIFTPSEGVSLSGGRTSSDNFCVRAQSVGDDTIIYVVVAGASEPRVGECPVRPVVPPSVATSIFYDEFLQWVGVRPEFNGSITSYKFSFKDSVVIEPWTAIATPTLEGEYYLFKAPNALVQSYEDNRYSDGVLKIEAIGPGGTSDAVLVGYDEVDA